MRYRLYRVCGTVCIVTNILKVIIAVATTIASAIGICYAGGLTLDSKPADTRTDAQKLALRDLISALKQVFLKAVVKGHYQLSADIHKACPCFDAEQFL